jgi:hypothetical protein
MVVQPLLFSLVTLSVLMNSSIGNQGNHCIVAGSMVIPPVFTGNLVLVGVAERCQEAYVDLLLEAFDPLLRSMGYDAITGGK